MLCGLNDRFFFRVAKYLLNRVLIDPLDDELRMLSIFGKNSLEVFSVCPCRLDNLRSITAGIGNFLLCPAGRLFPQLLLFLPVGGTVPQSRKKLSRNGTGGLVEGLLRSKFWLADYILLVLCRGQRRLESGGYLPGPGYVTGLNRDDFNARFQYVELILEAFFDPLGNGRDLFKHRLFDSVIDHRYDDGVGEQIFQQRIYALLYDVRVVLPGLEVIIVYVAVFVESFRVGNLVGQNPLTMKDVIIAAFGSGCGLCLLFAPHKTISLGKGAESRRHVCFFVGRLAHFLTGLLIIPE